MTADDPSVRAYEANIWKSYLYQFLMSFQLWWPIWVVYLQEKRGLSLTQITGLETIFWLIIVAAQVPSGAVADRWARKAAMFLASGFLAVGIFVFAAADNYVLILVSYAAWALAVAFQSGADAALVYDSLRILGREHDFQKVIGRIWATVSLGVIGGLLLGSPIAAATDLTVPIFISSGIAVLAGAVALSLREPQIERLEETKQPYLNLIRESVGLVYRRPSIRYAVIYAAILGAAAFVPIVFVQPFLVRHDVGIGDLGWLQVPNRLGGIVGALVAYRVVVALGDRRTFVAMPAILVASYCLLAAWDSALAYLAFPIVTGVSFMSYPVVSDYLNRRIPSAQRATILSVRQLLYSLALAAVAPLLGLAADELSLLAAFWSAALLLAPIPLVLWLWWRSEEREVAPEPLGAAPAVEG